MSKTDMSLLEVESYSFWDNRIGKERPVILYGTGNGADKIIDRLFEKGVSPQGVFASDGFVRDRSFRGMKVLSYDETIEKFGNDITVVVSFGSGREDVINFIKALDERHELIIPEVPLYGGELFDLDYRIAHEKELTETYSILSDDYSKELFCDAVNFRLTGKLKYLLRCEPFEESVRFLTAEKKIGVLIDGGAYNGDTVSSFKRIFPSSVRIIAAEPDPGSYGKLALRYKDDPTVYPVCCALGDTKGEIRFSSSSGRGSGVSSASRRSKEIVAEQTTVDAISCGERIDLIKLDVEGLELESLKGARNTIQSYAPDLIVSLYHKTDDLFVIPSYLKSVVPEYAFYLRRPLSVPMWDLNLIAVKRP